MTGVQISAQELHTLIEQGLPSDSLILDVRTPEEFSKGAIPGAKNIPVDELTGQVETLRSYKKIYSYCLSGGRSQIAVALLASSGIDAELYNVTSGILAWRKEGYTLV
ncbi:MAG: rhodanese-like domain-containing protein [Candidatus Magasanikbacteria bacterium]|nr:rhodanese-like domain-containing protein [Candidatus Magasanikbacteria bacterium]